MKDRYQIMIDHSRNFKEDRPAIKKNNADPMNLVDHFQQELEELRKSLLQYQLYTYAAGEDTETSQNLKKDVAQEIADLGWFVLAMFESMGMDAYEEMMEKAAFNILRYQARYWSNGYSYEESRMLSKENENQIHRELYGFDKT